MKKFVLASVLALTAFAATAAPIFVSVPGSNGDQIILTDEKNDLCPGESRIAVIRQKDGRLAQNLIGCWVFDTEQKKVRLLWMTFNNYEPSGFVKVEEATPL